MKSFHLILKTRIIRQSDKIIHLPFLEIKLI